MKDDMGSLQAPEGIRNDQFVADSIVLHQFESDGPNVWKGGLYLISDV